MDTADLTKKMLNDLLDMVVELQDEKIELQKQLLVALDRLRSHQGQ